ncbi:MAG TPA: glycine oxidase ThiO [Thermoanaerobaculia bacterium]|jgi:glycine oxidase
MSAGDKSPDVLIVGGGAIGLALADELAGRGHAVRVLDRGAAGAEASWAAAGLLSPQSEARSAGPFFDLAFESRGRYDAWIAELEARSGRPAGFRRTGLLRAAFDGPGEASLREFLWQRDRGLPLEQWDSAAIVRRLGPDVCPGAVGGLYFPDEAAVDPRKLTRALDRAIRDRGVEVREETAVRAIRIANGRCLGVEVEGASVDAGCVVDAAGAWAGRIGGLPFSVPVEPVRGQIVELDCGASPPSVVLHGESTYLVPQGGGRVLVGATVERAGFQKEVTAGAISDLLAEAARLYPLVRDARFVTAWSGLRPGTRDGLPILGGCEIPGLYFATGHYRNGILLAPVTAARIADAIEGRPASGLASFGIERFARSDPRPDGAPRGPVAVFG